MKRPGGKSSGDGTKGLFVVKDPTRAPDVVVFYLHGGGFAMGSPWFYLEFLLAWADLLSSSSEPEGAASRSRNAYANPAVFAPDYTLVPGGTFPTQVRQVITAYEYACGLAGPDAAVEVAGDSAGATLALSLLLHLALEERRGAAAPVRRPDHATLISAWCRLISKRNANTPSDYLNADSLHLYARQYMGACADHSSGLANGAGIDPQFASPGDVVDEGVWKRAVPEGGVHFIWGREEVLGAEIWRLVERLRGVVGDEKDGEGGKVVTTEQAKQIHAWPVVDLFLAGSEKERLRGLRRIVGVMEEASGR